MSKCDDETLVSETNLTGYLTGNNVSALLHPEMPKPSRLDYDSKEEYQEAMETWQSEEMKDEQLFLRDLLPDEVGDGEYEFQIRIEATPVDGDADE